VNDPGAPVGRFDLPDGTQLTLHRTCLVHRGGSHVETIPLAAVQALRVGFERNERRLRWAVIWLVIGLLLFATSAPLSTFASGAVAEIAGGQQGVARVLHVLFRLLEAVASLLPVLAAACAIGAAALGYFGWRGATLLHIHLASMDRMFAASGRDALMLEFAATVSERLMSLER
jgi:hypothetical protein